ncbi:hypothetical protein DB313_05340 (plasmid) [Borrelia turcica IST7]|uniref:Phage terminase large subunit N-terminal domain-containing protein n=1 Tax=Borrelia turcica IST7 TaxID=1104446 RepID=A0A386PN24_9SPIR|nr:phage terminase large subunit [Borrelia turcica]AYE36924.1 hypothetical protein DB313_05340 [Borrelia turcica IST7]
MPKFACLKYAYNKIRHKLIASSRGMCKTHNSARIWLEYLITEQVNDMIWFRYTESAVYDSFIKLFGSIIDKEGLEKYAKIRQNKHNELWKVRSPYTNSVPDFRDAFSPPALKGIEGKNKVLFDEATEFSNSSLLKLEGNIKREDRVEIWYCFNFGEVSRYTLYTFKYTIKYCTIRIGQFISSEYRFIKRIRK